jgi:class I fructose-bisphosphate aldolase
LESITDLCKRPIEELLGSEAELLLTRAPKLSREHLHLPSADVVSRSFEGSDRSPQVLRSLQQLYGHGRLANTGYLSILPVDQGIEHSAAHSFAPNPAYFDSEAIVELAVESGCSAVASTLGVLGSVARRWAHRIPFLLKLNHNQLLTAPNVHEQILFASVDQAWNMGAVAVGATIYFGSDDCNRELQQIAALFEQAHSRGLATVLWCYLRNPLFKQPEADYHLAADLTGQANHLGVTIGADIIKQKLPENNGGYPAVAKALGQSFGMTDDRIYNELCSANPVDLCRYQVLNCYSGRIGLINSGGAAGNNDLHDAVRTAVINKRAGGCGLIMGRKAFQRPRAEGIALIQMVQNVYLNSAISVA